MRAGVFVLFFGLIAFFTMGAQAESPVAVLAYHRFGPAATELTTIRTGTFAGQLAWLRANNVAVVSLANVVSRLKQKLPVSDSPAVALTADDGHESVYTEMFPLIRRYAVHATLFVYPSAISNSKTALTWGQIAEMQGSGLIDVQSHTFWHPNFHVEKSRLDAADYEQFARRQLTLSKARIASHVSNPVDLLAWPFGIHDPQLEQWAGEAGYVAAFGIDRRRVGRGDNMFALPRFEITDADRGDRFAAIVLGPAGHGGRS